MSLNQSNSYQQKPLKPILPQPDMSSRQSINREPLPTAEHKPHPAKTPRSDYELKEAIKALLSDEDIKMFGAYNRCPKGYFKTNLLGKGGCATVW